MIYGVNYASYICYCFDNSTDPIAFMTKYRFSDFLVDLTSQCASHRFNSFTPDPSYQQRLTANQDKTIHHYFEIHIISYIISIYIYSTNKMSSGDKTIMKVCSKTSPKGDMGQKYLASGKHVSMRMWEDEKPGDQQEKGTVRDYETVGFVLKGKAQLEIEGQTILLEVGDSWLVPRGASHSYKILEEFSAVEATSPVSFAHNRDAPQSH
eukprot:TRINITY_DN1090_c0_g2_i5.p1 TRINITY_DN1090_c0_g2~~TRINITY_DN1090_c0_g2_i5.p1  ORF type:complete len:209 (+),score=31.66 TRINITY_DN1090_c0_g2_i5:517-1143(+)